MIPSLKKYSMNLSEQEYHAYPAWSYSLIARYARGGFKEIKNIHQPVPTSPEMVFGSLLDCMVTRGMDAAEAEYAVCAVSVPSEPIKAVFENLARRTSYAPFAEVLDEDMLASLNECAYQPRWKDETRLKYLQDNSRYYDFLCSSKGKTVVSLEDWNDAVVCCRALKTSDNTKNIFSSTRKDGTVEYIYQAQFEIIVRINDGDVPVKIMPDVLVVNHKKKIIVPVDLKHTNLPVYEFPDHFVKMRYDIQGCLYSDVIQEIISNDLLYKDYTIAPYKFVVINRTDRVPVVFSFNQHEGLTFKNYTYKTWNQLLSEILDAERTEARVPSYISLEKPNDIIALLNNQ